MDFSDLIDALKYLCISLFGLGISFYKFGFKSLRKRIRLAYKTVVTGMGVIKQRKALKRGLPFPGQSAQWTFFLF